MCVLHGLPGSPTATRSPAATDPAKTSRLSSAALSPTRDRAMAEQPKTCRSPATDQVVTDADTCLAVTLSRPLRVIPHQWQQG